jgi:hypothetical protein
MKTAPNHWLQATRDYALLFLLAHWPCVLEPNRLGFGSRML